MPKENAAFTIEREASEETDVFQLSRTNKSTKAKGGGLKKEPISIKPKAEVERRKPRPNCFAEGEGGKEIKKNTEVSEELESIKRTRLLTRPRGGEGGYRNREPKIPIQTSKGGARGKGK